LLDPQGFDAGKKIMGRKRHILVDTLGLLLSVAVHPANIQDRDGVALVQRREAFHEGYGIIDATPVSEAGQDAGAGAGHAGFAAICPVHRPCFCGEVLAFWKIYKKPANRPQFSVKLFIPSLGTAAYCRQREGRFLISLTILSLILSLLMGAALGLWFTVHVLVLAIVLALVVVAGAGVAAEARLWWIALDIFVVTTCLQLGYTNPQIE
jgi:Transposase DDE domain